MAHDRPSRGKPSLETMARKCLWPTPTKGDAKRSGSRSAERSAAHAGTSLTDAVCRRSTPLAKDSRDARRSKRAQGGPTLVDAVRRFPTPAATDGKTCGSPGQRRRQLSDPAQEVIPAGGLLNPEWVEWLMGWPIGWTDLQPLATARFQQWLRSHGGF